MNRRRWLGAARVPVTAVAAPALVLALGGRRSAGAQEAGASAAAEAVPEGPLATAAAEEELVGLINGLREAQGLPPMAHDAALRELARERSADMARRSYFSHEIPGVGDAAAWALGELPDAMEAAENLGRSNAGNGVVIGTLFGAWVESPGHRRNLLKPELNRVGIGVAEIAGPGETTTKLVTQLFAASDSPLVRTSAARATPAD